MKNPAAIAHGKVKGHITDEMVKKGTHRDVDKQGNDWSDDAAAQGAYSVRHGLHQLAVFYKDRHARYQHFA